MLTPTADTMRAGAAARARSFPAAFTLLELLIVTAIISLLAAVLMPALTAAREQGRRVSCAANLRGVAQGLAMYQQQNQLYPRVPLTGRAVEVGTARESNPFEGAPCQRSVTASLYLLIRDYYCQAGQFICPSTTDGEAAERPSSFWDFADGTRISYAVQCPYGNTPLGQGVGGMAVLADRSPYFVESTGLRNAVAPVDWGGGGNELDLLQGNSPNHLRTGQNVCDLGGSVRFQRRADCGIEGDDIYTRAAVPVGAVGTIPPGSPLADTPAQGAANSRDSFLID